jgi:hypothetical protein
MKITKTTKQPEHYVDNSRFYAALVAHFQEVDECKAAGLDLPRVPEYIGECIVKIANRLATRANFASYTFREEMILDGIENCFNYLGNFDPANSKKNPFAYFSQICYYAFVRRIAKEKKYNTLKDRLAEKYLAEMPQELVESASASMGLSRDRVYEDDMVKPKILKRPKYMDDEDLLEDE